MAKRHEGTVPREVDAVIVGAGFAGLYMLYRLRGLGLTAQVIEAGGGVGGTWYWNRYPGARCDVESMQYSYSFSEALQQEWHWSDLYAGQPEILRYANHVTDRFDLRRNITFDTSVIAAHFDAQGRRWLVRTDRADVLSARFCVLATGCLSTTKLPEITGIENFHGRTYHTGRWPHERVDFSSRRVAVIGTGSSAIQSIPVIAEEATEVTVFQRTPNYSIPSRNGKVPPEYEREWKSSYAERRHAAKQIRSGIYYHVNTQSALEVSEEERQREYEGRWATGGLAFMAAFSDLILDEHANETAAEFVRAKIRATVRAPSVAEALTPRDYPIGTKRLCVDTHYYETFNRNNVTLVNLRRTPITAITSRGVRTTATEYDVDSIVFATGFDAMTGTVLKIAITGRNGETMQQHWRDGPRLHLGLMAAGFPNLFVVTGPGSPSVLSNMMVSIEQHVDWIADCIAWLRVQGRSCIEPTAAAEAEWVAHVSEVGHRTLYPRAASWYMGANVPGKPRVFMPYIGGVALYREICDAIAAKGYEGFSLSGEPASPVAAE